MLAIKLAKMEKTIHLGELLEDLDRVLGGNRGESVEPPPEAASKDRTADPERAQPAQQDQSTIPAQPDKSIPPSRPAQQDQPTAQGAQLAPQGAPPIRQGEGETGELWDQVVDRVAKKKSALGALLQHGQLGQIEERVVTISFPKSCNFHRERAQAKNNREVIEGEASELLGRDVRVRFSLADIPEPSARLRVDMESRSAPPSPKKIIKDEPIIGNILEILDGELLT
jgi:hypothetical protein